MVGSFDHDYTRPRTPPEADKIKVSKLGTSKLTPPKPRGKENRETQVKKEVLDKRKVVQLPPRTSSRVAFRPRNQMEEYNVLYSFLIRGGCLVAPVGCWRVCVYVCLCDVCVCVCVICVCVAFLHLLANCE